MKKYVLEVTINEGNDELWEEMTEDGKSGCDELVEHIKAELENWNAEVKLIGYKPE